MAQFLKILAAMPEVQSLVPSWQKERTDYCNLFSNLYMHATAYRHMPLACIYPEHTHNHKYKNQDHNSAQCYCYYSVISLPLFNVCMHV